MRRASKVDENQKAVVSALRSSGATVTLLHAVGGGCPDLLAGYRGGNYLIEVKDGSKPPSARKLTEPQVEFHRDWRGQVCVVTNPIEALAALGIGLRGVIR